MKNAMLSLISFFVVFFLLSANALAQIQYYEINTELTEEGRSLVNIIITFTRPVSEFSFNVLGKVENLNASSIAGPINCSAEISGTSLVSCSLNLTAEKRQIQISYETNDFVRALDNKFFFSGDFGLGKNINQIFASLKLPENSLLAGETLESSRISFPDNASAFITPDRKIMITWDLSHVRANELLKLEAMYEQVQPPFWFQLRIRHFILFGFVFAVVLGFIIIRYYKKSEKLVLSVLDEYERKIIDIILASEGAIKQKKVVRLSNLSKAKVSRVVKSLAERGLIEVERVGRTNKLKLVKKRFKL